MSQFRPLNHTVFIFVCSVRECSHFTDYRQLTVNPAGAQAITQEPTPPGEPVGPAASPQAYRCSLRRDAAQAPSFPSGQGRVRPELPGLLDSPLSGLLCPETQGPRAHRAVSGPAGRQKYHFRPGFCPPVQKQESRRAPPDKGGCSGQRGPAAWGERMGRGEL